MTRFVMATPDAHGQPPPERSVMKFDASHSERSARTADLPS
jgi:hypothetical protein